MGSYSVAVLGGDGIGPEVTYQAVHVLDAVGKRFGHTFAFHDALVGQAAIAVEGAAISDDTLALCQAAAAVLFGAVGGAGVGDPNSELQPEQALFRLRRDLQLFANVRPVRPYAALLGASALKRDVLRGVDLLVVRELTGGLYYGKPSEIRSSDGRREAVDTMAYTEAEIERVLRFAFEQARMRRRRVTSVDKANVLSCSRLWRDVTERVAREFGDVTLQHMLVDTCAMNLIRQPAHFDVIVTENMFGDILTDEASMLTGSMGMLPSASLGTRRTAHGLFGLYEPIHGTAPDITGQGKANPIAAILSSALLLRYSLGLAQEAAAVERAVASVIGSGSRTADIARAGGPVLTTAQMGAEIATAIEESAAPTGVPLSRQRESAPRPRQSGATPR